MRKERALKAPQTLRPADMTTLRDSRRPKRCVMASRRNFQSICRYRSGTRLPRCRLSAVVRRLRDKDLKRFSPLLSSPLYASPMNHQMRYLYRILELQLGI